MIASFQGSNYLLRGEGKFGIDSKSSMTKVHVSVSRNALLAWHGFRRRPVEF